MSSSKVAFTQAQRKHEIRSTLTVCSFPTVGEKVAFFQPDDEVVGEIFPYLPDLHQEMPLVFELGSIAVSNK